jgi:imidazolonepropionase-like amidohydrolase
MRMQTRFGSIAVGKRADLAILTGDPIADITKLRTIERTVRAGVVYTSAPLFEAAGVKP